MQANIIISQQPPPPSSVARGSNLPVGVGWWADVGARAFVVLYDQYGQAWASAWGPWREPSTDPLYGYHEDLSIPIGNNVPLGDMELWGGVTDNVDTVWTEQAIIVKVLPSTGEAQITISTSARTIKRGDRITVNAQWNYFAAHQVSISLYSGGSPYGNPADTDLLSSGAYNQNFELTVGSIVPFGEVKLKAKIIAGGNITIWSNEISLTVEGIPNAPSNLVATPVSSTEVGLTWHDNSTNEIGFKVEYQKSLGDTWHELSPVSANITSATVTGLVPDTYYLFRVRAYNSIGNSEYSNTVTAKTLARPGPPRPPRPPPGKEDKTLLYALGAGAVALFAIMMGKKEK